jgi:hypothetical protein
MIQVKKELVKLKRCPNCNIMIVANNSICLKYHQDKLCGHLRSKNFYCKIENIIEEIKEKRKNKKQRK